LIFIRRKPRHTKLTHHQAGPICGMGVHNHTV